MIGDVQTPDDWKGKKEYPEIGDEVRNVGKVAESDQIKAFAWYNRIPEFGDGPALKRQDNGDGQDP